MMVNEKMLGYGTVRSAIRDLFEYGRVRALEIGKENVYDFSLGNPSIPAPEEVAESIKYYLNETDSVELHGYTSAQGDENVRRKIAKYTNSKYGTDVSARDVYMTCGAAASLAITFKALTCKNDEFVAVAPFFPEYRVFIETAGAKLSVCEPDYERFMINFDNLEKAVTPYTKGIIINYPNNPTGVILDKESSDRLVDFLNRKSEEYGHHIFLITDEPYRELVYDSNAYLPCYLNLYDYTIMCYSFSKSLSIPGERIGYIIVNNKMKGAEDEEVYAAICGAGRALGYVCAPSLMQRVVSKCLEAKTDIDAYNANRELLYTSLVEMGFDCIYPDGAFYLFMKSPIPDSTEFMEAAKKYEILIVPADSFGAPGYLRLAYCVSNEMIKASLPAFRKLAKEFGLNKKEE